MSVCVQSTAKRLFGGVYGIAVMFVVGAISTGIALGHYVAGSSAPKTAAVVTKTAVLQDSDWLSEAAWRRRKQKKLRKNNFSGRSQLGFNPFGQNVDRSNNRASRGYAGGNYRTVCVRLCDGYYFPISFSTTSDRFASDEQSCRSRCSDDSRLFYYRNSDGSPETMVDRRGQAYAKLRTAFLYRTSYNKSCQCRPAPWSDASKQRHAMYKTKDWQRKARRLARQERKRARYASRTQQYNSGIVAPQAFAVPVAALPFGAFPQDNAPRIQLAPKRYSQARVRQAPRVVRRQRSRRTRSRSSKSWKSFITDH